MLRSLPNTVFVLAVVPVTHGKEQSIQFFLSLGGNLSVFLGEHIGADAIGPGILLRLQLGYDDSSGAARGSHVWVPTFVEGVGHEPSELLSVPLELGLLLM